MVSGFPRFARAPERRVKHCASWYKISPLPEARFRSLQPGMVDVILCARPGARRQSADAAAHRDESLDAAQARTAVVRKNFLRDVIAPGALGIVALDPGFLHGDIGDGLRI